jgi:NAD/NADP transhydrogenase alpha subunit
MSRQQSILILLLRETRAGETRVALVPNDIRALTVSYNGTARFAFERGCGERAGFSDLLYEQAGAEARDTVVDGASVDAFRQLFAGVHTVVRAKRAAVARERVEAQALSGVQRMIGALDVLERNSDHVEVWRRAGVQVVSIDQLVLPVDDPGNLLARMSELTGALAFRDAVAQCAAPPARIVVLGFGVAGRSALHEALEAHPSVTHVVVLGTKRHESPLLDDPRVRFVQINADAALDEQVALVRPHVIDADVVIASARRSNTPAPVLIPNETLHAMRAGAVVIDLALTEGGNVEGAEHDCKKTIGSVIVKNTSGYPKAMPQQASELWSRATKTYLERCIGIDRDP